MLGSSPSMTKVFSGIEKNVAKVSTRLDFYFFCGFDEVDLPDHSTLCRFRNWPAQDDTLARLLELINCQLTQKGLKIEKAPAAVIDATIIQTAGGKQRQAIETDENGITAETLPSKDKTVKPTGNICKANSYPTALCVRHTVANL